MKTMYKIIATLVLCLAASQGAYGQNGEDMNNHLRTRLSEYVPTFPEVAGMQLYGDIPVSEYTGTPDISIPLYTLKTGSIELPITLSYHAGGLKVSQEASWAGLGWNLLAGGSIDLIPAGNVDDLSGTYATWEDWEKLKYNWNNHGADTAAIRVGTEEIMNLWGNEFFDPNNCNTPNRIINEGLIGRGERDVYEVTLPNGCSFKYFLHPRNQSPTIIGERRYFQIAHRQDKVTVVDDSGTIFVFEPFAYISNISKTYLLTRMSDVSGHSITFAYTRVNTYAIPTMNEYYSTGNPPPGEYFSRDFTYGVNTSCYLNTIETQTEKVTFTLGSREDLHPGTTGRLTNMKVTSKLDGKTVCQYRFDHDYFEAPQNAPGGNYLSATECKLSNDIPEEVLRKRLKLLSVTRMDGTNAGDKHSFAYNEEIQLPYKTSFAQDYWGYYNGEENYSTLTGYMRTLIPPLTGSEEDGDPQFVTAIRNSSRENITACMLKKIIYPTGGTAEFEFEPHTLGTGSEFVSTEDLEAHGSHTTTVNTVMNNAELMEPVKIFTIAYKQTVTLEATVNFPDYEVSDIIGSGASIHRNGPGNVLIKEFKVTAQNTENHRYHVVESFTLEPGEYRLASTLNRNVTDQRYSARNASSASLTYHTEGNLEGLQEIGGGVRIKEITLRDKDGTLLESTAYSYEEGCLMHPVVYHEDFQIRRGWLGEPDPESGLQMGHWENRNFRRYYTQTQPVPASSPFGHTVGYGKVTKLHTSEETGKEVFEFGNTPAEVFDITLETYPPNCNGKVLKHSIYDKDENLLWEGVYNYEACNVWKELVNIRVKDNYIGPTNAFIIPAVNVNINGKWYTIANSLAYHGRFEIALYPNCAYDVQLLSSTETDYRNGTPLQTVKSYTYNKWNKLAGRTSSTSRGEIVTEQYQYAVEAPSYPSDFKNNNLLDALYQYKRTEGSCTYCLKNEYAGASRHFVLLSSTEDDTFHPMTRSYSYKYDGRCNPVEELGPDGLPVTVLWGYDYSLPVARIMGATYEAVKAKVGESALAALCSAAQPDAAALGGLKALFPDCLVTTWLHEPSFGVKEETAPNGCRATCGYDAFGRPVLLADHDGNPVRRFAYQTSQAAGTPNYVLERTATREDGEAYMEHYGYHDGLGRLTVSLDKGITPAGGNLASLQEYDLAGRKGKAWLPVVTADVNPAAAALKAAAPAQYAGDARPYAENVYEASPRELATAEYGPGEAWQDKPVSMERLANTAAVPLDCKDYSVGTDGQLVENGKYAPGKLSVVKTTDEDGHVVYTFTDMQGRTILTRAMDGTTAHDTYSVYDDSGNLRYVLQPMYQEDGDLSKYAFRYEYDERNRLESKTLPGTETVLYEYDLKDRMTFSQDGNQREAGKWTYYLYDGLNRLTEQGECTGKDLATKTVLLQNYYDDYGFRTQTGFDNADFPAGTVDATGYLTGTVTGVLGSNEKLYTAYYYDIRGRVVKEVRENILGGYDVTSTTYTFTGSPQAVTHTHTASGKPGFTESYAYTYDHAERVTKVEHTLDGTKVTLASYEYDDLGRQKSRTLHGNTANKQSYAYNIRGWLTNISGNRFMQNLYYETGSGTPCYNGNIGSMTWRAGSEGTMRGYKFTYDGLNRLRNAEYGEGMSINANAGRFSENVTNYDLNGNITGLQRYGQTGSSYGLVDNLTFTLNGNRLDRVDDSANGGLFGDAVKQANEYAYDENGNMTQDLNKNISEIEYNCLNLPGKVTFTDESTIAYTYAADGTKLETVRTVGGATTTTDYCGNAVYENGTLKFLLTEEGYVTPADGKYHYYLRDHQGNNRVVVDQNGTVEEVNHYYPFGGMFASTDVQPYKYNGKEWDEDARWYDYGARNYDAAVGRFITTDPSAESYSNSSTYAYCLSNPVKFVDPDGRKIVVGTIWQRIAASLGFENYVTKVYKHLYQNNMDSRRIQSLYKQLEQSDLIFRILPISESPIPNASEKGNHVKPDKPVVRGEKQGGTIYYDPDSYFTVNKEYRTPRIGLAHELGHLENLMKGKAFPIDKERKEAKDPVELYRNELNEANSIELENIIRGILNEEIRHSYFKNSTIDEEEKDEKKKINNN